MKIAIDLHNIRDGGGVNYIRNLLEAADPAIDGFDEVHLIGAPQVLEWFPVRPWIFHHAFMALGGSLPRRLWFVATRMPGVLRKAGIDVLFSPGGIAFGSFRPYVTISRNMMPFRPEFWDLYPRFSTERLRLHLLRWANAWSFARADGMIFLSQTAKQAVSTFLTRPPKATEVVPHGVNRERFKPLPRADRQNVVRLIYPSRFEPYKHQIEVIEAVRRVSDTIPDIELRLCGPANPPYFARYETALSALCDAAEKIRYLGEVPNAELPALYAESDLMLFASSCENLPNILIEAMSCGIPVCSSDRSPMPEIGQDACLYFDPTDPASIAASILEALADLPATGARAERGMRYAAEYSWDRTARRTFAFIRKVADGARE